jgi:hypothetical protein
LSRADNTASLTERILQLIKEVEISGEFAGARVEAKATLDSSRRGTKDDSLRLLSLVNSSAKRLPDILRSDYYVLIDDLDLHWVNSPTQNSFIAALFTSLRHFSRPPRLKCVVALRDNIYRALPLIDPDKFHDAVCEVRWDLPTVQRMLEARIEFKLNVARSEIWGGLFPEDAIHSIWMNSDGRPREAIRLANLAVTVAADHGHPSVSTDDLSSAIKKFSEERLREVASEWQFKLPGLEYFLRRMAGWPKEFPLSRFKEILDLICVEIPLKEPGSEKYEWLYGFAGDTRGLARILIEHDVFLWKASRTDRAVAYDPKHFFEVNDDTWLAIHPMFGAGLGLIGA